MEEMDEKDGTKFHRGQPNDIGLVDKMEEDIELRKQINTAELNANDLDDVTRLEIEGFRKGTYLRLEILDVPFEMVEYFDPCHPVLERGIGLGEENVGYMQARLKRHRWHKVLDTRDPIIVSIGWRRFQTIPVYAIEDRTGRYRMLKYTPEHMHCLATFWDPLTPPQTGILLIPRFYNPLITALMPPDNTWQGMKTVAELLRQHNLSIPVNMESLYKAALPFESMPKNTPIWKRPLLENRRAVVMETHERKVHALVQHLKLIWNEKMKKRKLKEEQNKKQIEAERELQMSS